jgi:hypothetical protein
MDDVVLRAMAKWPNVPAVYGWLRLDRRGDWWIRNERVGNPAITAFIGRNYAHDDRGRWFFQNGPQRVFVTLDYAPFVFRVTVSEGGALELVTHTGRAIRAVSGAWIDEDGALLLSTELGIGVVDDRDLARLVPLIIDANGRALPEDVLDERMERLQQGRPAPLCLKLRDTILSIGTIRFADVPARFGFVRDPEPRVEN